MLTFCCIGFFTGSLQFNDILKWLRKFSQTIFCLLRLVVHYSFYGRTDLLLNIRLYFLSTFLRIIRFFSMKVTVSLTSFLSTTFFSSAASYARFQPPSLGYSSIPLFSFFIALTYSLTEGSVSFPLFLQGSASSFLPTTFSSLAASSAGSFEAISSFFFSSAST